ncbi:hypothetical protein PMIN06_004567 [Paraphaeosphaeria minitans]|uniref:Uncharacterized protein n=1 Tax=Paraphaeosphaeria minitans TaxID=565426 RepID=A0A9P6G8C2_9PLEO|nr:hypothetical protein PMIN01_10940 [Paraphaeosphaeria minitans]
MAQIAQIIVADFSLPKVTYRIAASRAQQYGELIAIARRIYERPADEYKAHVHFQAGACDARAAEVGWDEGWYLGPEFRGGQELVVYVHFERWSLIEKIDMAKSRLGFDEELHMSADEKELARLRGAGDDKARAGRWWDAVWWWKMARKVEVSMEATERSVPAGTMADVKDAQKTEEAPQPAEKKGLPDFVKNEILEVVQDELSGAVHINLSERLHKEIVDIVKESVLEVLGNWTPQIVQNEARGTVSAEGLGGYAPRRKRRRVTEEEDGNAFVPEERLDTSKFPWPISYPSQVPATTLDTQEVITVDAYATKTHYSDLIVGRALPSSCRDPNIRPLVRAQLVLQNHGNLRIYTYMPSRYGKVPDRTGELQIPTDGVEYLPDFDGSTKQERSFKMAAVLKKNHPDSAEVDFTIIDTYTGSRLLDWDIIVGHARSGICADAAVRPLVRASLTNDDKVTLYMPAKHGVDRTRAGGELLVAIRDVKVRKEFDAPTESRRRDLIKEALVRKSEEILGEGWPGVGTERPAGEGSEGCGDGVVDW